MSGFISNLVHRATRDSSSDAPNATLSAKSKQDRRRAQVRNAQRKHRERRESYVNATANSVRALRDFNKLLMEENALLQSTLRSNHVAAPVLPPSDNTEQAPGTPQYSQISAQAQPFQFRVTQKPTLQHESIEIRPLYGSGSEHVDLHYLSDSGMSSSQTPPLFGPGGGTSGVSMSSPTPAYPPAAPASFGETYYNGQQQQQQALTFAAADFILALEHACMSHIDELADPTGSHNHTMSHQVLWSAPSSSMTSSAVSPAAHVLPTTTANNDSDTPPYQQQPLPLFLPHTHPQPQNPLKTSLNDWSTATATLDKLISLSTCLALAHGEITPVQAWFKLLERTVGVDQRALERLLRELTEALRGEVRCYGFGAVLDEELFERLLARVAGGVEVRRGVVI